MPQAGPEELLHKLELSAAPLEPPARDRKLLIHAATRHLERFLANHARRAFIDPGQCIAAVAEFSPPERGRDLSRVLAFLAGNVDSAGVSLTSPDYLGYIPAGGLYHSAVGDLIAAVTNRFPGLYSVSPGAAALEEVVIRWLADVIGYPANAGGVLTSGGSSATLTAIVVAREAKRISPLRSHLAVAYQTRHAHYCIEKALSVAGLGRAKIRNVRMDRELRMSASALEDAIVKDRSNGLRPWLVVGSAGTVSTGSVDPLEEIAGIAEKYGLWFHVDGAYGGLFSLCDGGRKILKGIERSDSIVVDPHKTLFVPYGTGAVMVKDRRQLYRVFRRSPDYIPKDENDQRASAYNSPELSRHYRGLRIWLPLQLAGVDAFRAALSEKLMLASYFYDAIRSMPDFIAGPKPALSIVTFRFRPRTRAFPESELDLLNEEIERRLREGGRTFVTSTKLGGRVFLRAAILSYRTHLKHIKSAIRNIRNTADQLLSSCS